MKISEISADERALMAKAAAEWQAWKVNRWYLLVCLAIGLPMGLVCFLVQPAKAPPWPDLLVGLVVALAWALWLGSNWKGNACQQLAQLVHHCDQLAQDDAPAAQ